MTDVVGVVAGEFADMMEGIPITMRRASSFQEDDGPLVRQEPYILIRDLENLGAVLKETRRRRGVTIRAAAVQMDLAFATVHRAEQGRDVQLSTVVKIAKWLTI